VQSDYTIKQEGSRNGLDIQGSRYGYTCSAYVSAEREVRIIADVKNVEGQCILINFEAKVSTS
jgi:hypothetical protein